MYSVTGNTLNHRFKSSINQLVAWCFNRHFRSGRAEYFSFKLLTAA